MNLPDCSECDLAGAATCHALRKNSDRRSALRTARLRRVARGDSVFDIGDSPGLIGVVRQGYLRKECLSEDGRRSILGLSSPGDILGDMPGRVASYALEAATDTEICAFPGPSVAEVARGNVAFWRAILDDVQRQYHQELAFAWLRSALRCRPRLVAFLLMASEIMPSAPQPDGSVIVTIPIGRRDWADLCNMTGESISRQMTDLAASGEVQSLGGGRYRLSDPQALRRWPELAGFPLPASGRRSPRNVMRPPHQPHELLLLRATMI